VRLVGALGLGVLAAGLTYYVREERLRTSDGYLVTLRRLPARARPLLDDVRRRFDLAVTEGRQAASLRATQVQQRLAATGSSSPAP
jgi:hypothetical protein